MVINVGGLWDTPVLVADEMPYTPSICSDIVCVETIPCSTVETYRSYEDCTYFKCLSPLTNLQSDPEYSLRSCDDIEEISGKEQPKRCSDKSMDNQYALNSTESEAEKCNVMAVDIHMSENILCARASKSLRVRSSAAKDRHSKVNTAKGLRDTRVRLSLSTAVKFYELQFRLGFDRPSKVLDWLISKAQPAIDELQQPSYISKLNCSLCNCNISKSSTSLATGHVVSTCSQAKHGCSEHATYLTQTDTCRSGENLKRKSTGNGREAKEPTLRSCSLMKVGTTQLVAGSDPKDNNVSSPSTRSAIECLIPESAQRV